MNRKSNPDEIANSGLVPQLDMMVRALWAAPVRNTLFLLSGALFLVIAVTAYGQIRLNNWNQPFYDALSHRDFEEFLVQLGVFGLIAGALLVLNVAQRWLGETLKLRLRQGLARDLIQNWLQPGRAFRLSLPAPWASIRTNACTRMRGISPSCPPILVSVSCSPRSCWSPSWRCCGRCRMTSYSTSAAGILRYRATWCGPPSSIRDPPRC